ncbi:hypothetical protein E8E11_010036 [Didymella keratinophila]|nr:hypothetical protein E8E11_010036 [Didymella keratinophila]
MSDSDSMQLNPVRPKNLYRHQSNVEREIALVDFLNKDDNFAPDVVFYDVTDGVTIRDRENLYRMGKKHELKRKYRPLSALSFAIVLTAIWEYLMIACTQGLVNGGLAGLFWSYIWTFVGFTFVEMSLAELALMAPTSGGQYHWISGFAPPQYQQFLSYVVGWISTMASR